MKGKIKFPLYICLISVLVVTLILELYVGINKMNKKEIAYTKESNMTYSTYLKSNSHYSSNNLKSDYNLVASLIDYLNIDYAYRYTLSENIKYHLEYDVTGVLEIYDSENEAKPVERKTYTLYDKVVKEDNAQVIKVDIQNQKIDYDTYNRIIQEWKKEISPNANLKVSFNVKWNGYSETLGKEISDSYTNDFSIPISQKTITISNPKNELTSGKLVSKDPIPSWYKMMMLGTLGFIGLATMLFIAFIAKYNKSKSRYDQKISKILREFDRAITEAKGKFTKVEGENYIEVTNFMELLDVHDNINEPIIYYKNSNDVSVFVVKNGNDNHYSRIKRSDFDE